MSCLGRGPGGFRVALALGWFLAGAAAVQGASTVGGVRVIEVPWEGGVQLAVENTNLAAVTLTITVKGENARPDRSMPVTFSCPGPGTFPFLRLQPIREDEGLSWRVRYDWQFGQAGVKPDRTAVYALPFASGGSFRVAQGFRGSFTHHSNNENAVDFTMPEGTPVHAARAGIVQVVVDRFTVGGLDPALRDAVNTILLRHADGTYGEYVHLRPGGAAVRPGQKVKAGDLLGYSGNTGYTQGPHLHFAVFRPVNGTERETFRMKFRVANRKAVEPREGEAYTAP